MNADESIVFEYLDPDGTQREDRFALSRSTPDKKSFVEIADTDVTSTRRLIVEGALFLQSEIRKRARLEGQTVETICEASVFRDLNPWAIETFTNLVVLSKTLSLIHENRPRKITYLGENQLLGQCLRKIAIAESVKFISTRDPIEKRRRFRRPIGGGFRKSPLLHLLREVTVRCHFKRPKATDLDLRPKIALVAPLAHFVLDESHPREWSSGYFGKLPDVLVESGYDVVLVHHPVPALSWRKRRRSGKAISRLSPQRPQITHLPSRPPISIPNALASWFRWRTGQSRVAEILNEMDDVASDSGLGWLWTFLRPSAERGLFGHQSLIALATKTAMDSDTGDFGDVDRWVVASENQPWEQAFVSARRKEGHVQFDAFVNVPVRPWDFRIFTLAGEIASGHPRSERWTFDRLLVTSPLDEAALSPFVSGQHQICAVEALRFRGVAPPFTPDPDNRSEDLLLVLGDYDRLETELVIRVAEQIAHEFGTECQVEFRAHPLHVERDEDLAIRVTKIGTRRPERGLQVASVVASSCTSAIYPYLFAGYPVVIALGQASLNFCPILEFPRLRYLSDSSTGIRNVAPMGQTLSRTQSPHELLFLDDSLSRWRAVLNHAPDSRPTSV